MKKTVSFLLLSIITFSCFFLQSCDSLSKDKFEYFQLSVTDVLVGESTDVLFEAKLSKYKNVDSVEVFGGEEKLGDLYDNGENGDKTADDGVFSATFTLSSATEKHVDYYAKVGDDKSETVTVFFYTELTQADFEVVESLNESLYDVQSEYMDSEGYVGEEDMAAYLSDMVKRIKVYIEEGSVKSYTIFNDIFSIELSSGITHLFFPNKKGILSSGSPKEIITVEPYASSFASVTNDVFVWLDKKVNDLEYQGSYSIAGNASMIDEEFESYRYEQHLPDSSVTVSRVKDLGDGRLKNGVLIWQGHGGYSETVGSVLITGEDATKKNNESIYSADLKEKRLVTTGGWYTFGTDYINCNYGITSKFVDKYFKDNSLDNALVFLGACLSGTGEELVDSLLNKGEDSVVFACVGSIGMEFEAATRTTLFYNMCKDNGRGKYPTAEDAIKETWDVIGAYDSSHSDSFVACFGNKEYRLSPEMLEKTQTVIEESTEPNNSEEVYKDIIERYKFAADNNFFDGDEDACGDINMELWFSAYDESELVYSFVDLSDDGSPEMIIAALNEKYNNGYQIYDIWGQKDGEPQRIFNIYSMGYRSIYTVTKDNYIMNYHSALNTWDNASGYEYSVWEIFHKIYSVVPDSTDTEFVEGFKREDVYGEQYCYYISDSYEEIGNINEYSDYEKKLAEHSTKIDFEWMTIHEAIKHKES